MTTRRVFIKQMLVAGVATALPIRVLAADWPKQTVKLIVPFAAGGNTDGIARLIGQYLGAKLGGSFIIENRPGAGGIIAANALARAAPDGYTMMMAALPQIAVLPVIEKADYDPKNDFTPISNVASNPFCLVSNPEFDPKTLQEFTSYVKARPGKLAFASGGTGSLSHLTMVLFLQRAGLDMEHVPYKGGAPAIADVMGNQVPVYFGNLSETLPLAGRGLRPIAVSGAKRVAKLPDVPTVAESGYPGFRSETWNGLIAPLGIPEAIVNIVAAEVRNALKDPVLLQRLDIFGVDPIGSTPAEFRQTMADDIAQWGAAIKAANIKL